MWRLLRWFDEPRKTRLAFVLVSAAILITGSPATAQRQSSTPNSPAVRHIVVTVNKSRTIVFNRPIKTATIASTKIADVTPITDRSLFIQGKEIGTTNISVFDDNMQLAEIIDLEVSIDAGNLQAKIRASTGSPGIRVSTNNNEVVLSGMAPDAVAADRAVSVAQGMASGQVVVNAMTVAPSQQVMLKVRFLEVTRSAERDIGVNWFGTTSDGKRGFTSGIGNPAIPTPTTAVVPPIPGDKPANPTTTGGISVIQSAGAILSATGAGPFGVVLANLVNNGKGNLNVMISALEAQGLVRRLAEPNLVTLSGENAKFLAGGSFPIPTVSSTTSGNTPSFVMQPYGVSLNFVPTVLGNGLINLRIAPEVSELDFTNTVTISGTTIPSILQRNAQTTVQLRDGQSFAIAGLLQNRSVRNLDQLPWIGSVPILGALFRSAAYQNNETDLVIIVTPHLVQPASPTNHLATPFDQRLSSNDIDYFVNGQLEVPKQYLDYVTSGGAVKGPYGAIIPVETGSNQPASKGGAAK
jgi:pilus assembly protein CpaC